MDRKTYPKRLSHIKQEYKGRDSIKKALIIMLDAQYEYFTRLSNSVTAGLDLGLLDSRLAASAKREAIDCCREMAFNADNYANIRFYINTPYFSRTGNDQFTCYAMDDPRVKHLVKIVDSILEQQPDNGQRRDMINIVVRCYWHNHTLSFHSDRKEFGEHVYGAVLHNSEPEQGLILKQGSTDVMMLDEKQPMWWHMTGTSRWNYEHGYCSAIKPPHYNRDPVRISVSFRYYQSDKYVPKRTYHDQASSFKLLASST